MRILILHTQYLPALNPNVFRWAAIAEYWVGQEHEVCVLCSRRSGEPNEGIIKGVKVYRAGHASLLDTLYNLLGTKYRRGEEGGHRTYQKGRFRLLLEKLVDMTWRSIYWPDGSRVWYLKGYKKALQLHNEFNFDAIVSVAPPFTPHLVAAKLKKQFPQLHWLMDIEDPFSFSESVFINNRQLYGKYNYRREAQLLSHADTVSVTLEAARKLYIQHFPKVKNKIFVIPPLYSMPDSSSEIFETRSDKIHLGYFGAFYHPIRTPDALLELFFQINQERPDLAGQLILHFFGEIDPVFQPIFTKYQNLIPSIKLHGLVSRNRVAAAMQAMDFLVNVGNTTNYHLPSKCVDYMMSGKPIINLSYCKNDPFIHFMKNYPLILNLDMTKGVNKNMDSHLYDFILIKKGKAISMVFLKKIIKPYTLPKIADQYFKCLQNVPE